MSTTVPRSMRKRDEEDEELELQTMFEEMERLNQKMREDQAHIEQVQVEIAKLREESAQLRCESHAILARLGAEI